MSFPAVLLLLCAPVFTLNAAVTYRTASDWGDGFSGELTITNDSTAALENWTLEFEWDRTLDTIWNARLIDHTGARYSMGPQTWNASIPPGGKVVVGFSGSPGRVNNEPRSMALRTATQTTPPATVTPPAAPVKVSLSITASGDDGFAASVLLQNRGNQPIDAWTLTFALDATITSIWNAGFSRDGTKYTFTPGEIAAQIPAQGAVVFGFTASGTAPSTQLSGCTFNGAACDTSAPSGSGGGGSETPNAVAPLLVLPPPVAGAISIASVDTAQEARQLSVTPGVFRFALSAKVTEPKFVVASNDTRVFTASIVDGATLEIKGLAPGRAALRIQELSGNSVRYIGVRVKTAGGFVQTMPDYVALGSVSEDTPEHLDFWRTFQEGDRNRRVQIRYIYLNGGPRQGWNTWTPTPGARAANYIRNSRSLGMMPFFVFYNIPESAESALVAINNSRNASYMADYFRNLNLLLDIINRESPDEPTGILLEPDFLAYLAQSAGAPASSLPAATRAIYDTGVLTQGQDPPFTDTVRGMVEAINYLISTRCKQCYFGWHVNLWASPAGGWRTPIPAKGIVRLTDDGAFAEARTKLLSEASAIAAFYLEAGIASRGARFLSLDKYGFDAAGFEGRATIDPAGATWFWNADHWNNYLAIVRTLNSAIGLPVVLWQLPVGRINSSQAQNPYSATRRFADLGNTAQAYEDSAPTYFLGDRFTVNTPPRRDFFSANRANDPKIAISGDTITWGAHMTDAAQAGVAAILFGAGIPASTNNIGAPPSDGYWWITKAQQYQANPAPLPTGR